MTKRLIQQDALISTIVCILNVNWGENEKPYLKTLLLNSLHYLGWTSTKEIDKNLTFLIEQVKEKAKYLKRVTRILDEQLSYFENNVCNAFRHATRNRENKIFSNKANKGQIIYSSIAGVGYCYVSKVLKSNEYYLSRPGFKWVEKEKEFINPIGDKIYNPIPLTSMILINL